MSETIVLGPGSSTFRPSFCDLRLALLNLPGTANGRLTGAGTLVPLIDCKRLVYSDSQDSKFLYGASNGPLARHGRVTKVTGEIEFGLEVYQGLLQHLFNIKQIPGFGALQIGGFGDVTFDLPVSYLIRPGAKMVRDVLRRVRILGSGVHAQSSGKQITVVAPLGIAWIDWGVDINGDGATLTGSNITASAVQ